MIGLQVITFLAALLGIVLQCSYCSSPTQHHLTQHFEQHELNWHAKLRAQLDEQAAKLREVHRGPPTAVNPKDKEALVALYESTNGAKWNNNTGWMKGDPCIDVWHGVYCANGRILDITLVYNAMSGTLPSELAQADQLHVLRFYSNQISGAIPVEILQLKSLQILDLDSNAFTNTLPDTISMPNLTALVLYVNHLTGAIPTRWETPQLQILELSTNTFDGDLPESISQLKNLQQLVVSRNNLTGTFPSSYGSLQNLQQLWLFLNSYNNPSIPESWSGMSSLQNVQIDSLTGALPSYIGSSWSELDYLVLVNGELTGQFYTTFCELKQIKSLRLFKNKLTGSLPTCLCDMVSMTDLELSDNQFTGSIPNCIGKLSNLATLYFSRNNMSGNLPSSLGDLSKLQILDVSTNLLTGSVPSTYTGLKEIVGFSLCYNKLSSLQDGLDPLYNRIKDYSCELYSNPWSCPLPSAVPSSCGAECSKCNSGNSHTSCSSCVSSSSCGWCNEGPNCLEGTDSGPYNIYRCSSQDWSYGSSSSCP